MANHLRRAPFTSKYGYSGPEMLAMALLTAVSNFWGLPGCMLATKSGVHLRTFVAWFCMFTSFMYHLCESIGMEVLLLDEGQWHKLDNVGSICGIVK